MLSLILLAVVVSNNLLLFEYGSDAPKTTTKVKMRYYNTGGKTCIPAGLKCH